MNEQLKNRIKSLLWRTGGMIVAVIVGQFSANIDILAPFVNPEVIVVLGLVLGEVTKYLNK